MSDNARMPSPRLVFVVALSLAIPRAADAGEIAFPSRNPYATVSQWLGLTNITVTYTSPAVAGRAIWGRPRPRAARTDGPPAHSDARQPLSGALSYKTTTVQGVFPQALMARPHDSNPPLPHLSTL